MKLKFMSLIIVAVMICVSGCKTNQTPKHNVGIEKDKKVEAKIVAIGNRRLAVTGAVIVKQSNNAFYYKKQCLACGSISEEQIGSTFPNGTASLVSDFTCPKCGNKQKVRIDIH